MNKKLAVSILSVDNKIEMIKKLIDKGFDCIHYDVMDGIFVENTSISVEEIIQLKHTTAKHCMDVHLMTASPYECIGKLIGVADYISFHVEACDENTLFSIMNSYSAKTKLGIAINPNTQVQEISQYIPQLAFVLIMSVEAGKGGQKFIPEVLEKIEFIRSIKPEIIIEIDGGINDENIKTAYTKGVDIAVSGSFLLDNIDNDEVLATLKQ